MRCRNAAGVQGCHRAGYRGHKADTDSKTFTLDGQQHELRDGAVVIAAITSCTNTSNPSVMMAAGLLAKNAVKSGLRSKPR